MQPRRVDSLNVVGFVQAVPTVADGFAGQAGTFLSGGSINFIRLRWKNMLPNKAKDSASRRMFIPKQEKNGGLGFQLLTFAKPF